MNITVYIKRDSDNNITELLRWPSDKSEWEKANMADSDVIAFLNN